MSSSIMDKFSITELIQQEKKIFKDKQLIKPWLQSKLTLRGINIVIERSDESKIVFKCKCSNFCNNMENNELHSYKQDRKLQLKSNEGGIRKKQSTEEIVLQRKKMRDLKKKFNCPFRIRANFSYRSKNWTLVVVNENHNHPLFPISSSSPLSSQITSPQPVNNMNNNNNNNNNNNSNFNNINITSSENKNNNNYNYSSRLPSLPTSNLLKMNRSLSISALSSMFSTSSSSSSTSSSLSSSMSTTPAMSTPSTTTSSTMRSSPSLPIQRNLNELQLEFNTNLLRLNCMSKEEEVKLIYLKLLKVLEQENEQDALMKQQQQEVTTSAVTSISSNFGCLFNLTNNTNTNNVNNNNNNLNMGNHSIKTVLPSIQETLRYQHKRPESNIGANGDNAFLSF